MWNSDEDARGITSAQLCDDGVCANSAFVHCAVVTLLSRGQLERIAMERRHFLKLAFGFAAGAALAVQSQIAAEAAPLPPATPGGLTPDPVEPEPAVASQEDIERLSPEQVQWRRRRRYRIYRRRYRRRPVWGYRRRRPVYRRRLRRRFR